MVHHRRPGLTLLELLVVLVILAIMTTVAINATDSVVDQGRYDATTRTLGNIQDAIIGPAGQREPDGSLLITGFVPDMGRLPLSQVDPNDATKMSLRELWDGSLFTPVQAYGLNTVTIPLAGTTTVSMTLPCGWRGPYLRLTTGSNSRLIDGWGNPFDLLTASNSVITGTMVPVDAVRSRGADNQIDTVTTTSYNRDLYTPDQAASPPGAALANFTGRALGSITVQVKSVQSQDNGAGGTINTLVDPLASDGPQVTIVLLEPVNGVLVVPSTGGANPRRADFASGTGASVTFTNVSIGPRALQAFQYDPATGVKKKSAYTPIVLPVGGLPTKTLILQ
jgi:prepilin-type N-terminal cleavage/methylation domain-containing protein